LLATFALHAHGPPEQAFRGPDQLFQAHVPKVWRNEKQHFQTHTQENANVIRLMSKNNLFQPALLLAFRKGLKKL
jgi:hypothetical protein